MTTAASSTTAAVEIAAIPSSLRLSPIWAGGGAVTGPPDPAPGVSRARPPGGTGVPGRGAASGAGLGGVAGRGVTARGGTDLGVITRGAKASPPEPGALGVARNPGPWTTRERG